MVEISGGSISPQVSLNTFFNLYNPISLSAIQFDIEYPEGFSIDLNSIEKFDRIINHIVTVQEIEQVKYRFIIYSDSNDLISPGLGAIFNYSLERSLNTPGNYNPQINNYTIIDENDIEITLDSINTENILIQENSLSFEDEIDLGVIFLNQLSSFSISVENNLNQSITIDNIVSDNFIDNINLPYNIIENEDEFFFQFYTFNSMLL